MTKEEFSNINEEDIHSGKYVFRDVFEVGRYLQFKGWRVNWYAPPQFVAMDFGENKMIKVLQNFYAENAMKNATPADLIKSFEDVTHKKLASYIMSWLDGSVVFEELR